MPIYVIPGFCVGDFIQFHHSLKDIETKDIETKDIETKDIETKDIEIKI